MKKKILIFHQSGAIGGAGVSLMHIVRSLDQDKYEICVVCPKKPDDMVKELEAYGIKVIKTQRTPIIFPHYNGGIKYAFSIRTVLNILQIWRDKPRVEQLIRKYDPHIVAVNSMTMFMIGKYAKRYGARTVCFHRETYQKGFWGFRTRLIKKGLSQNFDKIIFISEYDKRVTKPCQAEKHVIYDKVELERYVCRDREKQRKKIHAGSEDKIILYLGGISKLKGGHVILDAMKYIKSENVKLLFVSNLDKKMLEMPMSMKEKVLKRLNLSSTALIKQAYQSISDCQKVLFVNTSRQPEKYYSMADIVVFPSTIAHQARPVYEAGAVGIPIIISDFEETKEFAKHGVNAITFMPGNSRELAEQIDDLIKDPEKCLRIAAQNREMTFLNHDLKNLKQELSEILEDL